MLACGYEMREIMGANIETASPSTFSLFKLLSKLVWAIAGRCRGLCKWAVLMRLVLLAIAI